jgi:hypothetical protein
MGWSTLVWLSWLAAFGVLELLGISRRVPWRSMSEWTWSLEAHWWPLPWLVIVALALLMVHLATGRF